MKFKLLLKTKKLNIAFTLSKVIFHTILSTLLCIALLCSCSKEVESEFFSSDSAIDFQTKNFGNVLMLESPDSSGTISKRKIILPPIEKYCHVAADSNHFRWIGASNRMFPWVGGNDLTSIFQPKTPTPPRVEPLTKGKIQIQSEGAEIFYRNIKIKKINKLPVF